MKIPTLHFEQIALGEIDNPGTVDASLQDIKKSNNEILEDFPASAIESLVREKLAASTEKKEKPHTFSFRLPLTIGFAAAACVVMALSFGVIMFARGVDGSHIIGPNGVLELADRAKGNGPILSVYRKEGTKAVRLRNNSLVREGDILQLSYVAAGDTFGAIISIDGKGVISRHFPDEKHMAGTLSSKGEVTLGFSFQLDNAPAYERFILISGKRNFLVSSIIDSIQNGGRFALAANSDISGYFPAGVRMTEILLFDRSPL